MSALEALEHLVGLQAQVPLNPYTALWSRLEGFRSDELSRLLEKRRVVRIGVMRATIHLVSADDSLLLRPLLQPVLDGVLARHPRSGPALAGVDLRPVLSFARRLLAERPYNGRDLRAALHERFPDLDAAALADAVHIRLACIQPPPRGLWGRKAEVRWTTVESWLGRPLARKPSVEEIVLRYLGAFGPASAADVATWSRLTGIPAVIERLRPQLRAFTDERGRELVDLPAAPRPDPDTPAPTRFLPEYDNVLLSHADRSRVISAEDRAVLSRAGGVGYGSVLVDGFARAVWRLEGEELVVSHLPLTKGARSAVATEGRRLLRFLAADAAAHDVRLVAVD